MIEFPVEIVIEFTSWVAADKFLRFIIGDEATAIGHPADSLVRANTLATMYPDKYQAWLAYERINGDGR